MVYVVNLTNRCKSVKTLMQPPKPLKRTHSHSYRSKQHSKFPLSPFQMTLWIMCLCWLPTELLLVQLPLQHKSVQKLKASVHLSILHFVHFIHCCMGTMICCLIPYKGSQEHCVTWTICILHTGHPGLQRRNSKDSITSHASQASVSSATEGRAMHV